MLVHVNYQIKIVLLRIAIYISCEVYCFELKYCTVARSQMLTMVTLVMTILVLL